jgi:hypothetical protein
MELMVNGKSIEFRRANTVYFNNDGLLIGGTLNRREQFAVPEGKTKAFRAGTTVFFNESGEVVSSKEDNRNGD